MLPIPGLGNFQGQRLKKVGVIPVTVNGSGSLRLEDFSVAKGLLLVANLVVTPVFPGAAPKVRPLGALDGLFRELRIERSANDPIKLFSGVSQIKNQAQWVFGEGALNRYKANSTTLNGGELIGLAALGATTQPVAIRESVHVPFENNISSEYIRTMFNIRGVNTARVSLQFGTSVDWKDPDDATALTSATVTGEIVVYAITADHLADQVFQDWIQYQDQIDSTVQLKGSYHEFRPQGKLQGFHLLASKGAGKTLNAEELREFEMEIQYNGVYLFQGCMADFQELNGNKSNMQKHIRSGAYMNILNNSTFDTALETNQTIVAPDGKAASSNLPLRFRLWTPGSINHAVDPVSLKVQYDLVRG